MRVTFYKPYTNKYGHTFEVGETCEVLEKPPEEFITPEKKKSKTIKKKK
jgi:hypothetical protein